MSKKELSEACRKHLAARWDDGHAAGDDERFAAVSDLDAHVCNVIELEVEDMLEHPELRGLTAVAISQDGETYYTTDEEAEDDE